MNNKEFTTELSRRTGFATKETARLMAAFTEEISACLENDGNISIQGFGTFEVKKKMEHVVVNPSTRQRMLVPPKLEIKFKASTTLKDKLN